MALRVSVSCYLLFQEGQGLVVVRGSRNTALEGFTAATCGDRISAGQRTEIDEALLNISTPLEPLINRRYE